MYTYSSITLLIASMIMFDLMVIPVKSITCKLLDSKINWNQYTIGWNITINNIIYIYIYHCYIFTIIYYSNIPSGCITSHRTGNYCKPCTCVKCVKGFAWALGCYIWQTIKDLKCIHYLIFLYYVKLIVGPDRTARYHSLRMSILKQA